MSQRRHCLPMGLCTDCMHSESHHASCCFPTAVLTAGHCHVSISVHKAGWQPSASLSVTKLSLEAITVEQPPVCIMPISCTCVYNQLVHQDAFVAIIQRSQESLVSCCRLMYRTAGACYSTSVDTHHITAHNTDVWPLSGTAYGILQAC